MWLLLAIAVASATDCSNVSARCSEVDPQCSSLGELEIDYARDADCHLPTLRRVSNLTVRCNAKYPEFVSQIESVDNLRVEARRDCGLRIKKVKEAEISANGIALESLGPLETVQGVLILSYESQVGVCTNIGVEYLVSSECFKARGRLICCNPTQSEASGLVLFIGMTAIFASVFIFASGVTCYHCYRRARVAPQPPYIHSTCCVCMDKASSVAYQCGHACCCDTCDPRLALCPICRAPIITRASIV